MHPRKTILLRQLDETTQIQDAALREGLAVAAHPAGQDALLSAFIPGLGQLIQRRFAAAGIQFSTVAAYLVGALSLGGRRALLLALCWSVWSVIDAYRHEAD